MVLVPSKPSSLLERIVILRLTDPDNPELSTLIDREGDVYCPSRLGGITSETFTTYIKQLADYKTAPMTAHQALNQAKNDLITATSNFRHYINAWQAAETTITEIKQKIDTLTSSHNAWPQNPESPAAAQVASYHALPAAPTDPESPA